MNLKIEIGDILIHKEHEAFPRTGVIQILSYGENYFDVRTLNDIYRYKKMDEFLNNYRLTDSSVYEDYRFPTDKELKLIKLKMIK